MYTFKKFYRPISLLSWLSSSMMTLKSCPLHCDGCEIAEVAILLLL